MDFNLWTWLNSNAGALGVIAAFALASVTTIYVILMCRSVKATERLVVETSRQWQRITAKSTIYYLVKIGYKYPNHDAQMQDFSKLTKWSPVEILQILQELHYEGRVEEDPGLMWRIK